MFRYLTWNHPSYTYKKRQILTLYFRISATLWLLFCSHSSDFDCMLCLFSTSLCKWYIAMHCFSILRLLTNVLFVISLLIKVSAKCPECICKWELRLLNVRFQSKVFFGFLRRIFSLLSAILLLGNIRYKKKTYRDDSIDICNPEVLPIVSELLEVSYHLLVIGVMLSFFMLVCVSIHTGASQ